jgi:SAM-dependent methyltransferase
MRDPRERFSDRVDDYVRYRPTYPPGLVDLLVHECGLRPACVVADIGSGTGILSQMLLATGARVVGVEPNAAMRAAAEEAFSGEPRFTSVDGSAEATGLPDASVDLVTAAQAFHWFDAARTGVELRRVLRPPQWAAVAWNLRTKTPFNDAYDAMLEELAPEYPAVRARDRVATSGMDSVFAPNKANVTKLANAQQLDAAGLRGRLASSSYAPKPGSPTYPAIAARLEQLFATHARDGRVEIAYETVVYWGRLG